MIIWEKVTIQDSSAKFSLALDSNHSGLRLSDANDNDANLSLNQLIATNLKLGNGLEYVDGDPIGQFNFTSPANFYATIYADQGLQSHGNLTLKALGSNIDVWCNNQSILSATDTEIRVKQLLVLPNIANFNSDETTIYNHLYAQNNVDVDGNISAQNFGLLQFPATFIFLYDPILSLMGQAIFSGDSEQIDENKKYRLKFENSESADTWEYTYNTWHVFDPSEEWPPLDEWDGIFVEFTVDGDQWSPWYQLCNQSELENKSLIVPIPAEAVQAQYVTPARFNGAVLLSRTSKLGLLAINTSDITSWTASMCWCQNYGYTASGAELNQGWKIIPTVKE